LEWDGRIGQTDVRLMGSTGYQQFAANVGEGFDLNLQQATAQLRAEASRTVLPRLRVGIGFDAQPAYLLVDARAPQPPREGEVADPLAVRPEVETHQRRDASAIGAYTFAEIKATDRLLVTPGVRFDWYALIDHPTVDPRLLVRFAQTPRTIWRGGVG